MAEGSPTLGWSIPNLITVTIMVVLTFAIVGFLWQAGSTLLGPKAAPASPTGQTPVTA